MKSLALASMVKSMALASRPQVLENWPVLGSRTAVFFELLKFCGAPEKFLENVYCGDRLKNFCEDFFSFFFLESTCACVLGRAWYGMKWNGNFGMEYGRCQNGMEWKISRKERKTIFLTSIPILY